MTAKLNLLAAIFVALECQVSVVVASNCPAGTTPHILEDERGRVTYCSNPEGILHGPAGAWYANGVQSRSDNWSNGKKDGRWTVHDENGVLREERYYADGLQSRTETFWYPDGVHKKTVTYFEADEKHGPVMQWTNSGEQVVWGQHRHGKQHGIWILVVEGKDFPSFGIFDDGEDLTGRITLDDAADCEKWKANGVISHGLVTLLGGAVMYEIHDTPPMKSIDAGATIACLANVSSDLVDVAQSACGNGTAPLELLAEPLLEAITDCAAGE